MAKLTVRCDPRYHQKMQEIIGEQVCDPLF